MTTNVLECETSRYQYIPIYETNTVSWSVLSLKCYSTAEINANVYQPILILIKINHFRLDLIMDEVYPFDEPLPEPVEGDDEYGYGEEEKKALKDLLETNSPLVKGLEDRLKAFKTKTKLSQKVRDDEEVDLAIELYDRVLRMRMTTQNLTQSVVTVFPLQVVFDAKRVAVATCVDDLDNLFGPSEFDIDDLVDSGGRIADLVEKFPPISLKSLKAKDDCDRPKSDV